MNSCGSMHGVVMHDNSSGVHVNSRGAVGHRNACNSHADELREETKALSSSTRCKVWNRSLLLFSRRHKWTGLLMKQGLKISQEVEIIPGCAVSVTCPSCLDNSPVSPGPGRVIRNMLGWSQLEKTDRSGDGSSVVPSKERIFILPLTQQKTRKRRDRTTQRGQSLVVPHVIVRTRTGKAPLSGHTGERCWPLLAGVWRAIAPLMMPWCAEGEVPTAANLNLYRGWRSCGWHRDDEPLFGECGEAKLIVSVSFGSTAIFRWRRQSCPDDEGHLCPLGHGDILVMDGQMPG